MDKIQKVKADLKAAVQGFCAEGLGMRDLVTFLDWQADIQARPDQEIAKSMAFLKTFAGGRFADSTKMGPGSTLPFKGQAAQKDLSLVIHKMVAIMEAADDYTTLSAKDPQAMAPNLLLEICFKEAVQTLTPVVQDADKRLQAVFQKANTPDRGR